MDKINHYSVKKFCVKALLLCLLASYINFLKTANASPEVYFIPNDYNQSSHLKSELSNANVLKNKLINIAKINKKKRLFHKICSSSLIGLDLVRLYSRVESCVTRSTSHSLSSRIDFIILIDDTKKLSAYILKLLKDSDTLKISNGKSIVSPSLVKFQDNNESVNVLIVGEEFYRGLKGSGSEKEEQWFFKVDLLETHIIPFLKSKNSAPINNRKLSSVLASPKQASTTTQLSIEKQPKTNELGTLCYKNGPSKKITSEDVLWLAKMIHGETRGKPSQLDADAMLWSIAQRTLFPYWRSRSIETLTKAYSQPINEKWTITGSKCREFHQKNSSPIKPSNCTVDDVERRAKFIKLQWLDITPLARKSAIDFSIGKIENPVVGSVGWFAPGTWRSREKDGRNKAVKANKLKKIKRVTSKIKHSVIDGNVYFYRGDGPNTRNWKQDVVIVVGPGETCY